MRPKRRALLGYGFKTLSSAKSMLSCRHTMRLPKRSSAGVAERALLNHLRDRRADALVITGAETDVCVLAAVLGAVDFGYRVVIASDAICSSADATHDALLTVYRNRFSEQIEIADTELILAHWPIR